MLARGRGDERGVAMVVVAILVVLSATVALGVAASSMNGTRQTVDDEARVQALAAAEGGRDMTRALLKTGCDTTGGIYPQNFDNGASSRAQTFWSSETDPTKLPASPYDALKANSKRCPGTDDAHGYIGIASEGTAADKVTKKSVFGWYRYDGKPVSDNTSGSSTPPYAADGAILEGGTKDMNLPNVVIHGDLVLAAGDFDCNSDSTIDGNVIVRSGSVSLSNQCTVKKSIYAKDDIQINNLGNHVGGDLFSASGDITINDGDVDGSVQAGGNVTIQNGVTVGKDVIAAGTGQSTFFNSTVKGNVAVGGTFGSFQTMKVTGNVTAAGTGTSAVAPDTTIGGNLKLGGPINTWNAGPTVSGTKRYSDTTLTRPTLTAPDQLDYPTWVEIPWTSSSPNTWKTYGWATNVATSGNCDYQNNNALVTAINNLTTPTVIDATACGANGLNLYGVTFNLKTDVTFIAKAFKSAQNLKVNYTGSATRVNQCGSSTSASPSQACFNLIVPDGDPTDGVPTCPSGASSTIYGAVLGTGVDGVAYSPCTLAFGTVTWRGQIMAGYPDPAGGNATVTYKAMGIPGSSVTGKGTVQVTTPGAPAPKTTYTYGTVGDTVLTEPESSWAPS